MERKNQAMIIAKWLFLSLIAVSVVNMKSTKIDSLAPVSNVSTDISKDDEKEKLGGIAYQIENLLIIFLIGIIMPSCIVLWLDQSSFQDTMVRCANLAFRTLSLMVTVFVPVVLVDANIVKVKVRKRIIFLFMFGFYAILMFGNLRYWINELAFVPDIAIYEKVNYLEPRIGITGVLFLVIYAIHELIPWFKKRRAKRLSVRK